MSHFQYSRVQTSNRLLIVEKFTSRRSASLTTSKSPWNTLTFEWRYIRMLVEQYRRREFEFFVCLLNDRADRCYRAPVLRVWECSFPSKLRGWWRYAFYYHHLNLKRKWENKMTRRFVISKNRIAFIDRLHRSNIAHSHQYDSTHLNKWIELQHCQVQMVLHR